MKLGALKTIDDIQYQCVSHAADGRPILRSPTGQRKLLGAKQVTTYTLGEVCTVKGLRERPLEAVIVSLKPLQARVTEADAVFHGAITCDGIRKGK